jgi:hypothetical protein
MADGVGTTHHVKIGSDYLILRQGSYRKRSAPMFGARFTTGDPDYNNLSFWQHWVQTCWIGGAGAETWIDDAMYDTAVGVDPSTHEVLVLARDLTRPSAKNYELASSTRKVIREFIVFNDTLYCLEKDTGSSEFWKYTAGTDTWSSIKTFGVSVRGMCVFSGKIFFGDNGANLTTYDGTTWGTCAKPSGRTEVPYTMKVYKGKMYVGFGRHLWRYKGDETPDGNTEFFDMAGVDYITSMELHLGYLYLASNNGHILRTDGNVTMDLWSWDGGVSPTAMRTYDGKLFVATNETSLDGTGTEGVLYQFTGSAVTELKRWGKANTHCGIQKMRVVRRHLFYGASSLLGFEPGFGVVAYNAVEDAHNIYACNRNDGTYAAGTNGVNHIVDDVISFGKYLWVAVRGHGVFRTVVAFRDNLDALATYDTTGNGVGGQDANTGWLVSSDFDAGTPGLTKLWRRIVVHADLTHATTQVKIKYSVDGGTNWVLAGTLDGTVDGLGRKVGEFYLDNVTGPRFKYMIELHTGSASYTPAVRGVVVSYLPQGDPNWQWEMIVALPQEITLLDGTTRTQDVAGIIDRLETAYREQLIIPFVDVDGTPWAQTMGGVLITDFVEDLRYIGPSSDGPLEGDIRLVLLEAVEQAT